MKIINVYSAITSKQIALGISRIFFFIIILAIGISDRYFQYTLQPHFVLQKNNKYKLSSHIKIKKKKKNNSIPNGWCYLRCRNFSFLHHYGPSTSFASQSSLGIIMENTAIENHMQPRQRSHSLKNRHEYEQLDGDYYDDDVNGSSSCSSGKNADNTNTAPKVSRGWRNVRAVMAYYYTLRKIKRNGALYYHYLV